MKRNFIFPNYGIEWRLVQIKEQWPQNGPLRNPTRERNRWWEKYSQ